jgi:replicative DNA helicase
MGNDQLVQRLISSETGINSHNLRVGKLDEHEWGLFVQASGNLANLPIFLDDTPSLTPIQLRTKCRRLHREYGLDLIVLDYLQLMSSGKSGLGENRVQEISYISRHLKELARELKVPLLAGAQLSRAVEQRGDKRPLLSDLRESGSIEQDADIVMFIYRDDMYNEGSERPNQADIIIAKHRNGPTGTISLHFNKSLTKFSNLKYESLDVTGY